MKEKATDVNIRLPSSIGSIRLLPCMGLGLYWAWVYTVMFESRQVFFPEPPADFGFGYAFTIGIFGAMCLALLFVGFSSGKVGERLTRLPAIITVGALRTLGTALFLCANVLPNGLISLGVGIGAGIIAGIGSGYLLLLWGYVYSTMDQPSTISNSSFSFICAFILFYLFIGYVPYPYLAVIAIALPILETILLSFSIPSENQKLTDSKAQEPKTERVKGRTFSVKTILLAIIFGFTLSILRELSISSLPIATEEPGEIIILIGSLLFTLILILLILFSERRKPEHFSLRIPVFFVAVAVILLFIIKDESTLLYKIIEFVGYLTFEVTVWTSLVWLVQKYDLSPYRVFGLGLGFIFIGQFLSPLSNSFVTLSSSPLILNQLVEPIVLMFILLIAVVLLSNERGLPEIGNSANDPDEAESPISELLNPKEHIEDFAKHFLLSERESEVLYLIATGRDVPYISKKLFISENTTKTHVKRIYAKTDVHSRQELMVLVDEFILDSTQT